MTQPIAYTYEADVHCVPCALARFGADAHGWVPDSAADAEGNSPGAIAPWDEPGADGIYCGTCYATIREPVTDEADCTCLNCTAAAEWLAP